MAAQIYMVECLNYDKKGIRLLVREPHFIYPINLIYNYKDRIRI